MRKRLLGFSLIEVLIALGIMALAASMVVPVVKGNRDKAAYEVSVMKLNEVAKSMEKHYLEKGKFPVFTDWEQVSAANSPLREYMNDVPAADEWDRKFKINKSTETEYELQGFGINGKLAVDYPDFTFSNGPKFKQKGKTKG